MPPFALIDAASLSRSSARRASSATRYPFAANSRLESSCQLGRRGRGERNSRGGRSRTRAIPNTSDDCSSERHYEQREG